MTIKCERCGGQLSATRHTSIEQVRLIHEATCPGAPRQVKR